MSEESLESITPDPTIWFEDGNVVVIAQTTGFRVHKSLLSRQSDVFRDMFDMPSPPADEPQSAYDCSMARVHDTSYDMRELLKIIYCGSTLVPP